MKPLAIVVAVVVVGGGGFALVNHETTTGGAPTVADIMLYTVDRGTLTTTVTENGSLNAKKSESVVFEAQRRGKITFLIEEGKAVEEGEVLCRMETTEVEAELQQIELDILQTDANLDTARTELEIQQSENEASQQKAQIALAKARNELERYRDGEAPKQRRSLEVAIKEAETAFSRAKKKHEDSVKLLEQRYINESQVEQDLIDFERADIQRTSARRDLEIFDQYTLPMAMTDRESAVSDAEREAKNASKRAKSTLRQREVTVESQEARLTEITKRRDELQKTLEQFTLKAPVPGILIYGDPNQPWWREEVKLGGDVWGGFTLFTIPDLRTMMVRVDVHEADINKIKQDQDVTVTMDTYPGLVLEGKVTKIASVANSSDYRGRQSDVKKFTVEITLEDTAALELKPGISAKAVIFVEQRSDVLTVPLQCVFFEEGQQYCFVQRPGQREPQRVAVTTALSNDTHVQITEGLAEGDRVLLYNPVLRARLTGEEGHDGKKPLVPAEAAEVEGDAVP